MRTIALITIFVILGGAAMVTLFTSTRDDGGTSAGGRSLGSVDGISLDGFDSPEKIELASFEGRPLVLNYWASWCLFCIEEMPDFQNVYERVKDRVHFIGVNVRDDLSAARGLAKATGVKYPLASDPKGEIYQRLRGVAMPTTWFVDKVGRIVERFSGPLTAPELADRIREHFGA
ncbi:MAG: TlpA family protein disulfide reductase [Candidatus Binatia bacterium]